MSEFKLKFFIPRKELLAIRILQSVDESRYVICGVNFEVTKDRVLLVATDGRKLGILKASPQELQVNGDVPEGGVRFTIDYPMLKNLPKASGGAQDWINVELNATETQVTLRKDQSAIVSNVIQGNYPKWRHLIPTSKPEPTIMCASITYLMQFKQVLDALSTKGDIDTKAVTVLNYGELQPMTIHFSRRDLMEGFFGMLMPVRSYGLPEIPTWLDLPPAPPAMAPDLPAPTPTPEPPPIPAPAPPPPAAPMSPEEFKAAEKELKHVAKLVNPENKIPKGMLEKIKRNKAKRHGTAKRNHRRSV